MHSYSRRQDKTPVVGNEAAPSTFYLGPPGLGDPRLQAIIRSLRPQVVLSRGGRLPIIHLRSACSKNTLLHNTLPDLRLTKIQRGRLILADADPLAVHLDEACVPSFFSRPCCHVAHGRKGTQSPRDKDADFFLSGIAH